MVKVNVTVLVVFETAKEEEGKRGGGREGERKSGKREEKEGTPK